MNSVTPPTFATSAIAAAISAGVGSVRTMRPFLANGLERKAAVHKHAGRSRPRCRECPPCADTCGQRSTLPLESSSIAAQGDARRVPGSAHWACRSSDGRLGPRRLQVPAANGARQNKLTRATARRCLSTRLSLSARRLDRPAYARRRDRDFVRCTIRHFFSLVFWGCDYHPDKAACSANCVRSGTRRIMLRAE